MSPPEEQVSEYLKNLGLSCIYQSPIFVYDDKNRPRVWTPDFYIPELGIYIEVCGSERFNYAFRKKIYSKNGFSVIFIHFYKEKHRWKAYLVGKIKEIEEHRHNEAMNIIENFVF